MKPANYTFAQESNHSSLGFVEARRRTSKSVMFLHCTEWAKNKRVNSHMISFSIPAYVLPCYRRKVLGCGFS